MSECWRIARRGNDLGQALDGMAVARARQQLAAIPADETDPAVTGQADALRSRIASYDRVAASSADAERQLRLLVARLEETATRGTELSLGPGPTRAWLRWAPTSPTWSRSWRRCASPSTSSR